MWHQDQQSVRAFVLASVKEAQTSCIFDCPRFDGRWLSFARLFDDVHSALRTLVWHKDQKAVSALILAICNNCTEA